MAVGSSGGYASLGANTFTGAQTINGAVSVVGGSFGLSGNISAPAWTTAGIRYANLAATLTDTTSSGTVANAYTDLWGGNTIAASAATTFTNYYTAYFKNPTAGTNVTLTNKAAIGADSISIGGAVIGANALAATGSGTFSTNVFVGTAGGSLFFTNGSRVDDASGSGIFRLFNNGAAAGININVGGNSAAFRTSNNGADAPITTAAITASGLLTTPASTTASAGATFPHGAAPTSPVNGDFWTTTAGAFVRINGVTKTFTLT